MVRAGTYLWLAYPFKQNEQIISETKTRLLSQNPEEGNEKLVSEENLVLLALKKYGCQQRRWEKR